MVDFAEQPSGIEAKESEKIALVELHSIGGLCEPDLTGSSHILIITYKTGEKIAKVIDAGAFQKKSQQIRNTVFEEIYKKFKVSGIFVTHNHFDHSGRLVALHKAVCRHHDLPDLPIYTSKPSRRILPSVLRSYHGLQTNNTQCFDEACGKFWQAFNAFRHNYAARAKKEKPGRKDHRSHGDKLRDEKIKKESTIRDLKDEFLVNGGTEIKKELKIPKNAPDKKLLNDILKAIKRIQSSESDRYSSNEQYRIDKTREAIGYLGIGVHILEYFEDIFSEDIPRTNRKGREEQIEKFREYIEEKIKLHRETLLPDITQEDIDHVLQNSHGLEKNKPYNIPGLPGVQMSLHPTARMLGSVAVKFIFNMVGGRVNRLLFSGDIGRFRENSLHGDPEIPDTDILVMETTYAKKRHPEKSSEVDKIIEFMKDKSGPILMPVFSLDRMYVVLHELSDKILSGEIDCPIYCRNILGETTLDSYIDTYPALRPIVEKIKFVGGEEAHKIMRGDEKCIMMASGGTFQETSSANNLLKTKAEIQGEPTIILTGYQPAGVGKILMEFCQGTEDPKATIVVYLNDGTPCELLRKNILLSRMFSGHGDHDDIVEYASKTRERILLIHGNPEGARAIQQELKNAHIVERGKTITLFESQST